MGVKFSFIINRELTEEQKQMIAQVIGSSMLRSEEWYVDEGLRCFRAGNEEQSLVYQNLGATAIDISYAVGALGENLKTEDV